MATSNANDSAKQLKALLGDLGNPKAEISPSKLSLFFKDVGAPDDLVRDELSAVLLARLTEIDARSESVHHNDPAQPKLHLHRHMALLGLCLLTSTLPETSQAEYLQEILIPLSRGMPIGGQQFKPSDRTRDATNFHLSYLDQFVSFVGREKIHDALSKLSRDEAAAYPPIYDYKVAWETMKTYDQLFKRLGNLESSARKKPTVYMFMSVKGGVGKTSAALSLATYFLKRGHRCGILDLDFSGPSLQFHLDVPRISEGLRFDAKRTSETAWAYPTFFDLVDPDRASKQKAAVRLVLPGRGVPSSSKKKKNNNLSYPVLVLPDSPTLNSVLSQNWDSSKGRRDLLPAIELALDAFTRDGVESVAIDMRPGLYGANGYFLRFISSHYPTYLILMGTPRLSDFATAVYECSWLSASKEFQWAGPTQYVVNMWDQDENSDYASPHEALDGWADRCITEAFTHSYRSRHPAATQSSALYIHATRIWPYYYYRADLPRGHARKVRISILPSDPEVRSLQDLKETSFGIDIGKLTESDWYKELSKKVFAGMGR